MKTLFLLFILTLLPILASATDFSPDTQIVYKTIDGVDLKLHVFKPAGHRPTDRTPTIVFFFGGGWTGGTAKQFYEQARTSIEATYAMNKLHFLPTL